MDEESDSFRFEKGYTLLGVLALLTLLFSIGSYFLTPSNFDGTSSSLSNENQMITHSVFFKLKHPVGSEEEIDFLEAAQKLANIPGVQNFECLHEVSKKNDYTFGLSMVFDSMEDYQFYNDHPDHIAFVQNRWIPEVADFMEIDHIPYQAEKESN